MHGLEKVYHGVHGKEEMLKAMLPIGTEHVWEVSLELRHCPENRNMQSPQEPKEVSSPIVPMRRRVTLE